MEHQSTAGQGLAVDGVYIAFRFNDSTVEHLGVFSTFGAATSYLESLDEGLSWSTVRTGVGLVEGTPPSESSWKRYGIVHVAVDKPTRVPCVG